MSKADQIRPLHLSLKFPCDYLPFKDETAHFPDFDIKISVAP